MLVIDAREAKQGFGRLLDEARRAPVAINKHGRKVAVMMAAEDFAKLEELYDLYWIKKAQEAAKEGFLGVRESAAALGIDYATGKPLKSRAKDHPQTASKNSRASRSKNHSSRPRRKK